MSLMALGVWLTQKDAGVFATLIPVLAFAIPAAIVGFVRLTSAYKTLSAANRVNRKAIEKSKTTAVHLSEGATTDPLAQSAQTPASVTEHTTLNLEHQADASSESRTKASRIPTS
jgi:hypothetical protein